MRKDYKKKIMAEGRETEALFYNCLKRLGYNIVKTDDETDWNSRVDFIVDGKTIQFKGNKTDANLWLELANPNGDKGWLFGDAELVAFHFVNLNEFKIWRREDLLVFVKSNVTQATKSSKDFLKVYQRDMNVYNTDRPTQEKIVRVSFKHIKHLPYQTIKIPKDLC